MTGRPALPTSSGISPRSRTLRQLQRQMVYDRLLERLHLLGEDWIIKGATALLARDMG
jgi:hypothetical protein